MWLSSPAKRVEALVGGCHVTLTTSPGGSGAYRRGLFWQGFFRAPKIAALAGSYGTTVVRIHAITRTGNVLDAKVTVPVSQGYG